MRRELRFSLLGLLGYVFGVASFWMGIAILDARLLAPRVSRLFLRKSNQKVRERERERSPDHIHENHVKQTSGYTRQTKHGPLRL